MSDNPSELSIGIRAQTDQASFKAAADAAKAVGGAFSKTFEDIERSKALADAASAFARVAVSENDAAKATLALADNLKSLNATDKEIEKTTEAFLRQTEAIRAADQAAALKAENDARRVAGNATSSGDEYSRVSNQVAAAGDVESNLRALSGVLGAISPAAEQATNTLAEALGALEGLGRLPAALKGLPDAAQGIAQSLGLVKTAQEAGVVASGAAAAAEGAQAVATTGVATSAGAATVGLSAMLVPLLPFAAAAAAAAAALAGLAAGVSALQQASNEANARVRADFTAQQEVDDFKRSGASLEDAQKKQTDTQNLLADATRYLTEQEALAARDFEARAQGPFGKLAAMLGDVFNVGGGADDAYRQNIADAKKIIEENTPKLAALTSEIERGGFASEEAADKAKAASDASAKAAEQSARAQEKAAADAERARQKQEAQAQAAADKAAREAEAQAQKIQNAQDAIAKSTENFANKQADLALQAVQKAADLRTQANDKALDTEQKYYRDTVKLAADARNTEAEAQRKFAESERQAAIDAGRKLQDLKDQALETETSAFEDGNYLQAAKSREALEKANKQALKEYERAADDRSRAAQNEAQERYIDLQEARKQRTDALKQERSDNQDAYKRAQRDAQTAQERSLEQARTAYERELATQQAFLMAQGAANAAYYASQASMAQAAANGGSTQAGIGAAAGSATVPLGGGAGGFSGSFGGLRPINNTTTNRATTNYISINANTSNDVYDAVAKLGLIP